MNKPTQSIQATNSSSATRAFPLSLICLTIGAFAIGMTEFLVMGLLPNVAKDLHVTISQAGQIITAYALGVAIGAPLLTMLTHSQPKKKLLIGLMGIFILGNALSMIAPTYPLLIAARVLTALAHGTFLGVGSLIATYLVSPDRRGSAVSIVLAGLTIANIIGVPIGTFIGQHFGWRASFGVITVLGVFSLLGIMKFIPVIRESHTTSLKQEIRSVLKPQVLLTLLVGLFGCASLFALFTYISPVLQSITGYQESSVTWILVIFGIGVTIGNMIGGKLADWKPLPYLAANFAVLAIILAVLTAALSNPILAVITIFLWGVAAFAIMPGIQLRTMTLAGDAPMLTATANHSALNVGNALGAYTGGLAITLFGLPSLTWLAAALAAFGLIGIGFSRRLDQSIKQKAKMQK
ncbi:MFS transporter [Paenibacillus sp. NEAU-GSW1]|uniref:MFS transporter n=1 Tax=Paenibacillus sp. NEAU-GSW1 TaxID=2682486 RepID=UPI0012E27353|nr:MFS transporter [Paenibacillus sp. NEAU-GSW1]MUT66242.1 MFS transporter [Paenibacillus sp. NEAU-GSW1]